MSADMVVITDIRNVWIGGVPHLEAKYQTVHFDSTGVIVDTSRAVWKYVLNIVPVCRENVVVESEDK